MGRGLAAKLAFLGAAACSSPTAPGSPPGDRLPPPPAANDCPAVGSPFGNAWFHAQDLQSHQSCQVYLEQDECVVAIWDDCTVDAANTERAWVGRLDLVPGGPTQLWLRSQSRGSGQEPRTCTGTLELEVEAPRALLTCDDGGSLAQIYLERVLEAPPLGESRGTLSTRSGIAESIVAFTQAGGLRMVAAVSEFALSDGGGLYLFRELASGEFEEVQTPLAYGYLNAVSASNDGRLLILGGVNDLIVFDAVSLEVVGHEALASSGDDRVVGIAITGANEMVVGIRRGSVVSVELRRYQIQPLLAVGAPSIRTRTQLERLLGRSADGSSLYLHVKRADERGTFVVPIDAATLAVPETGGLQLPEDETLEVVLADEGRSALFVDHQGFGELNLSSGQLRGYYPLPYLERSWTVGYDRARNWLLAGGTQTDGRLGAVYAVDRATGRPIPRPMVTNELPLAVTAEGDRLFAVAGTRIYQVRIPSD